MTTCRASEGGKPKCQLGFYCSSIELRGKTLAAIKKSRYSKSPQAGTIKNIRTIIVIGTPGYLDDVKGGIGFDDSFDKLIEFTDKAGFDPQETYVTYITKCFSRKRKPSVQEVNICKEYVFEEIQRLNPELIVVLGTLSLRLFNLHNKGGINKTRGQLFQVPIPKSEDKKLYKVVPSIDPAFFLFNTDPKLEQSIQNDYRNMMNILTNYSIPKKEFNPEYTLINSLDKLDQFISQVQKEKTFSFDTESRSLPWYREPMMCLSFHVEGDNFILPIYQHDPDGIDWKLKKFWDKDSLDIIKTKLKTIFEDSSISKIGWNIKYDINVVWKHLGIDTLGFLFDGMLLHHILQEQKPHGLKYCSDLEFGTGNYDEELDEFLTGDNLYDNIPDEKLWLYAAADAYNTFRLVKVYLGRLNSKLWDLYLQEVEPLIHTLTDAERYGHPINKETLSDLKEEYDTRAEELLLQMKDMTWAGFNPSSPLQVKKALMQMGYVNDMKDTSKASGFSTSKNILLNLTEKGAKLPSLLIEYRNCIKITKTYLYKIEKALDNQSRVHYSWMIHGTESGRSSCEIYHQLPRPDERRIEAGKKNLRDVLVALDGCKIAYADYSQVELRVLATLSQDQEMLRLFKEGKDIHVATASTLLGIPEDKINKHNRSLGKNTNFGLAYGSEGYSLIEKNSWLDEFGVEHPLTWDKFNRGMEAFKERFPSLTTYLEDVPKITRANKGVWVTPFGRHRRIGNKIFHAKTSRAAEREVVNCSIQSPAAAVMARTLNIIHSYIVQWRQQGLKPEDLWLLNTVHDSGAWNVAENRIDFFLPILKKVAERPIPELNNDSFPISIGLGRTLAEAELDENKVET